MVPSFRLKTLLTLSFLTLFVVLSIYAYLQIDYLEISQNTSNQHHIRQVRETKPVFMWQANIRDTVNKILTHQREGVVGNWSSSCTERIVPYKPSLARFRPDVLPTVEKMVASPEYQKFAEIMSNCQKTITVDMSRTGGQFGSQFNTEVVSFSLMSYVTRRSVVFSMDHSILGTGNTNLRLQGR